MPTSLSHDLKCQSLQLLSDYRQHSITSTRRNRVRNQLVKLNLGLVRKEAHHWVDRCSESYDDLIQVGCLGLIRAIERFDIEKGNAFSSFALPYIRGEIQHHLRDKGSPVRIPRRWLELRQQSMGMTRKLRSQLNRQPTEAELAAALKISLQDWQDIKLAYKNREPLSLDIPIGDSEGSNACLGDIVPDRKYYSFQLAEEDRIRLQQALVQLEVKTRDVVEFVFLQDLTQKEVAELLGISVVTVSRHVKKGLSALKKLMLKG
ncbi:MULTISPECIES: RNA polymerase sigma factor SigF [Spirulina sp. CCY15215]|uniref:RNA polymerase sigma factor SigF n=1 Tax=Spirulina sp. CCY15215 TaxID=2767591 RepID=UPI00194E0FE2|nr:RNA polymerase sigma factor SigF [Spirulina major]